MCEHEGQECPGRSCRCDCMTCMFGDDTKVIRNRQDLETYVWEGLNTDPNPSAVDLARLVDLVHERAEVEYGVTSPDEIEQRLTVDGFYALVNECDTTNPKEN